MQASGRSLAWSDSPQKTQRAPTNTSARKRRTVGRVVCANAICKAPASKGGRHKTTENRIRAARGGGR
jgi:hypothetical protein